MPGPAWLQSVPHWNLLCIYFSADGDHKMKRRILYLPIETKSRELLGKLLFATRATERGWIVLLGASNDIRSWIHIKRCPGVYVESGLPRKKIKKLRELRQGGFRLVNLCEENIVYVDGKGYCERKASPGSLEQIDIYFASGPRNANDMRCYRPEHADKIIESGNPRFDTLLPEMRSVYEPEARQLRDRYGRFLLVNTNFGRANPFKAGQDVVAKLKRWGVVSSKEQVEYLRRQIEYKRHQMKDLQTLLENYSVHGQFDRIIIRPHPVENHSVWKSWAENVKNVEVHYKGNAIVWMLAAAAILHTGCTTGIEGVLLDRLVFSYVPKPGCEFINQADDVSIKVSDDNELMQMYEELKGASDQEIQLRYIKQRSMLSNYVRNINPPLASDIILENLDQFDLPGMEVSNFGYRQKSFIDFVRKIKKAGLYALDGGRTVNRIYQKFPKLSEEDLLPPLKLWRDAGVLNRIPELQRVDERLWAVI
ncbi:MAG: surface carbohydrate biosynthesis protein [Gammaproteobacteria bacterium]